MAELCRVDEGVEVIKDFLAKIQGTDVGWKDALCLDWCKEPKMAIYACCCPCILAGQISSHNNKNAYVSCCCFLCCHGCHYCCFRLPDRALIRQKTGVSSDTVLVDHLREIMGSCCGCGLLQVAKQAGIGVVSKKDIEDAPPQQGM
eukprot:GEMP01084921.1.p1 GENE.GEMP01084921.1~~GEMP01084921.1.p1  ORF type:complete len:146 (+),score=16.11 GEMP01084921.1:63-500(+)